MTGQRFSIQISDSESKADHITENLLAMRIVYIGGVVSSEQLL